MNKVKHSYFIVATPTDDGLPPQSAPIHIRNTLHCSTRRKNSSRALTHTHAHSCQRCSREEKKSLQWPCAPSSRLGGGFSLQHTRQSLVELGKTAGLVSCRAWQSRLNDRSQA
jgi:hypothetical protein